MGKYSSLQVSLCVKICALFLWAASANKFALCNKALENAVYVNCEKQKEGIDHRIPDLLRAHYKHVFC